MANLNSRNKKQCQVIFGMLIPAMLLQQGDRAAGLDPEQNLAVKNCVAMIDEIFASHADDQPTIDAMHRRINAHRAKFTKKIKDFEIQDGVIGSLQLLASGLIRSKPGTRLDFILQTFTDNLSHMRRILDYSQENADAFEELFKKAILKVG